MEHQNIRIRLKAFDHRVLDQSAGEIINMGRIVLGYSGHWATRIYTAYRGHESRHHRVLGCRRVRTPCSANIGVCVFKVLLF